MRLELTRSNDHYPLKVARLPIPPSGRLSERRDSNPRPQPWQGCALPTELLSHLHHFKNLFERKTEFEPATPTMARLCSTNWATFAFAIAIVVSLLRVQRYSHFLNCANFSAKKSQEFYSFFSSATHLNRITTDDSTTFVESTRRKFFNYFFSL